MTEKQLEILKYLKEQITINSLAKNTGLSQKQIYQRILSLEDYGYNVTRKDFATGDVRFSVSNDVSKPKDDSKIIYTLPQTYDFRAIVISDTHLGNTLERLDVLDALYNYYDKEKIHVIFNCGDFLNGTVKSLMGDFKETNQMISLSNALDNYPYDENILNYVVLGNHDISFLNNEGLDVKRTILRKRYDIYPLDYGSSAVKVKNDDINFYHQTATYCVNTNKITFRGHSHVMKTYTEGNNDGILIWVPTLSDMYYDKSYAYPEALDVVFEFNKNGIIDTANISTLIYTDDFYRVGEVKRTFSDDRKFKGISNESFPKVLKKNSK